jgi:MFS family permease
MNKLENKVAWYLSVIGFLGIFSTTISKNPVLPLFIKGLGGQDYILGIIAAASPLAGILFSFPIGFLADRIGKRKLLIWSAIIFVISPLLYLTVINPLWLIPIRFFHGLATAIMGPIATAMIVTLFQKNKAEKLGVYSSATLFGRTLAPLLGGFIISYFGFLGGLTNYRLVYIIAFVLSLPIIFLVWGVPKEDKTVTVKQIKLREMATALKKFVSNKILLSTSLVDMATYFIYGVLEAYLPVFLIGKHIPANLIGLLFSIQVISIALTKPLFGKLADRINKRVQIMIGIGILIITTLLIYSINNYGLMLINVLFFGLGMSLSTVATSTYISDNVDQESQGTSMGLLSGLMDVGQTLGPFLTGFLVTMFSYQLGFYFSSVIALLSALFFFWANFGKKLNKSLT